MALPRITYNPKSPKTPHGGTINSNMPDFPQRGNTFPAVTIKPNPMMTPLKNTQPNIGQGPNGNAPQITYNPSVPAAANNPPPLNTIGQGLSYGNTGAPANLPPVNEPTLPPPAGNPNTIVGQAATGTAPTGPRELPPVAEPTLPISYNPGGQTGSNPTPSNPTPSNDAFDRRGEDLQARYDRLKAQGASQDRLDALQQRISGGISQPRNYTGTSTPINPEPTSVNNSPYRTGDLAELAPPVGVNTYFRDEGKSDQLQARKKKIRANGKKGKDTGDTAPATGEINAEGKKKKKKAKDDSKLSDKQKRNLKKRPQPGTPARPYINRGVTYDPFGYGGTLRV